MIFRAVVFLSIYSLFINSCSSKSSEVKKNEKVYTQCIPASDLLSRGIVGGNLVNQQDIDAKRVVMLYSSSVDDKGELCTAAPIAADVLLTAAHCVNGPAAKAWVGYYTSISCESGFKISENSMPVSEMVVNPQYDTKVSQVDERTGDVALVFLKYAIPQGYPIYKIAHPSSVTSTSEIYFWGYGDIGYNQGGAGFLRKTQFTRAEYQIDEAKKLVVVDQSQGKGVCSGDSGGPGLINVNGDLEILGVNSYVDGSDEAHLCQKNGFLALADSYRDWIEQEMAARNRHLK